MTQYRSLNLVAKSWLDQGKAGLLPDHPGNDNDPGRKVDVPSLDDRYEQENGAVFLSGIQALIRLPIEQMRRDQRAGLSNRAFITGFPGSPLGGYDIALNQARKMLDKYGIKHLPGQNEELAASTLMGTQMLNEHPHPDVDGVVGYWYGKGPGVDRSGDALKHGNFAGTSEHGAVVILSGEDHEAKSSSVPYQQEFAFEHHGMPVLYPATVSEFLEYGLHAAELSRYSGCWVALKLVGALCDGGEVVHFRPDQFKVITPKLNINGKPFKKVANHKFFPVFNVETERQLYVERHAAALAYIKANNLNRITVSGDHDTIGVISAGKSYADTMQAFEDLGLDKDGLRAAGVRVAKIGALCPLDQDFVREFSRGLKKLIVVEEKRDFLERQIGRAVCEIGPMRIVGKFDEDGQILFPQEGGMNSDMVAVLLSRALAKDINLPAPSGCRLGELDDIAKRDYGAQPRRTLNFCSGCPHNVSTKLAPGQIAWGAPGCHVFAAIMERPDKRIEAVTQLGGEGLPWIGLAPYTSRKHIVQNLGDGALMHSSYMNIRFAVTAGVNITFKIMFNGVIANTGGQESVGSPSVYDLVQHLSLEGVKKIVIIAKEPERYNGKAMPAKVSLRTVPDLEPSLIELSEIEGTTVLIYDGECANERRRRQKRGKLPPPAKYTVVNEDVCENCGDCGQVANCMSLQKVDTEFGAKTQIHQSSCNQDQACIKGECPSFVTVEVSEGTRLRKPPLQEIDASTLPEPVLPAISTPYNVYVPGLGGTGVITANAILAQAATLDGSEVKSYDQTGAAQKWGAVLSSLIISAPGRPVISNRVGFGKANLYLALDLLAAVDKNNLACTKPGLTQAVVNSDVMPSADMIRDPRIVLPKDDMVGTIAQATDGKAVVVVDARRIAEGLFGDYVMTNMVTIGAAYQAGLLPISAKSIETAIRMNGRQIEVNLLAFRAGRMSQCDPEKLTEMLHRPYTINADRVAERARRGLDDSRVDRLVAQLGLGDTSARLHALIRLRVADLIEYQSERYAARYINRLQQVLQLEQSATKDKFDGTLTETVARNLYKLMAYKDEYEVARLLTQETFKTRVQEMFTGPVRLKFNLQPPFMRWFGLNRKVAMGPWIRPVLSVLAKGKALRGSPLDPFGYLKVRREERELITWYESLLDRVLPKVSATNMGTIKALCALPDGIRGYEHVKSQNVEQTKQKAGELLTDLEQGRGTPRVIPVAVSL